jgi:hypothetical protein
MHRVFGLCRAAPNVLMSISIINKLSRSTQLFIKLHLFMSNYVPRLQLMFSRQSCSIIVTGTLTIIVTVKRVVDNSINVYIHILRAEHATDAWPKQRLPYAPTRRTAI